MRPWNDGDNWRTSAYVKYSNSTGGKGAIYSNSCDVTGEQDECQTCDMTEQIACYKRKWNEFKTNKLYYNFTILKQKSSYSWKAPINNLRDLIKEESRKKFLKKPIISYRSHQRRLA